MRYALMGLIVLSAVKSVCVYADTPLDKALINGIQRGDTAAVRRALRQGADVNCVITRNIVLQDIQNPLTGKTIRQTTVTEKCTPLLVALANDDPAIPDAKKIAILSHLLVQPDIQVDKEGQIMLDSSSKTDPEKWFPRQVSPLYYALYKGKKEMADRLMDAGIDLPQEDTAALLDLSLTQGFYDIAITLIHQGASVPQVSPHDTPKRVQQIKTLRKKLGLDDPASEKSNTSGDNADGDVVELDSPTDDEGAGMPFMTGGSGGIGFGSLAPRF